jgi:hypothetical protein
VGRGFCRLCGHEHRFDSPPLPADAIIILIRNNTAIVVVGARYLLYRRFFDGHCPGDNNNDDLYHPKLDAYQYDVWRRELLCVYAIQYDTTIGALVLGTDAIWGGANHLVLATAKKEVKRQRPDGGGAATDNGGPAGRDRNGRDGSRRATRSVDIMWCGNTTAVVFALLLLLGFVDQSGHGFYQDSQSDGRMAIELETISIGSARLQTTDDTARMTITIPTTQQSTQ